MVNGKQFIINQNRMKTSIFIIILLLMFYQSGSGQQIVFQLFSRNQCNGSIEKFGFYSLKKDDNSYGPIDTTYSCYLKDTGIYKLSFFGEKKVYYFNEVNGKYFDTLNFPKIDECYQMHVFFGFCCCGVKCDGYVVDYYTNGQKRAEGTFKGGKAISEVRYYYSDGRLQKKVKYNNKGKRLRTKEYI